VGRAFPVPVENLLTQHSLDLDGLAEVADIRFNSAANAGKDLLTNLFGTFSISSALGCVQRVLTTLRAPSGSGIPVLSG